MKEAALTYARNGWPVIPVYEPTHNGCSCGTEGCANAGKHPRTPAGLRDATTDLTTITNWWNRWPNASVGLLLGNEILALDVDPRSGGNESLERIQREHEHLSLYARARSGSGGFHYLFAAPYKKLPSAIPGYPGLETRTGNQYIVVEPSQHVSGGRYEWIDGPHPLSHSQESIALRVPPEWLVELATSKPSSDRIAVSALVDRAVEKARLGEGRNNAGLWLFTQLRDNKYSRDEAVLIVRDWVAKANEATPGQSRYTQREAEATLRSAYSREAREPWDTDEKPSQADILLKLIDDFEYFKSGPASDAYVRMAVGDHKELWKVDTKAPKVREILTHRFLEQQDRAPGREALNTVIDTVVAKCGLGQKVDVHVRFARSKDAVYVDLCDDRWRAIEVTKDGWRVVDNPPVLFRRASGARPLPVPVLGGSLEALRPLLNCGDDNQWMLMLGWLIGTFQPEGAFSHLVLEGEQGSAKSTTARILQSVLDPSDAGLCAPPKDEVDATVSAMHAGVLAYDNLSGCRAELSDVFCRFSTGQGYRTRTLYENLGVTVASVKLPVLLNGIDATVMRPDLMERSITLKLPRISPENRRTEQGIWAEFEALHAPCLGSLLDAVSTGLRNLPTTVVKNPPRMSDFCTWVAACEPALPWQANDFMRAYRGKQEDANRDLAENDSVASAIIEWAEQSLSPGTCMEFVSKDLLVALNEVTQGYPKDLRHWPASPEALAHRLVRLAPVLRAHNIELRKLGRKGKARSRWEVYRPGGQGFLVPEFILRDSIPEAA